jgi:Na+/H+ antiporter
MGGFLVVLLLLAGVAILAPLADKIGIPAPVVLTVYGIGLALIHGIPRLHLTPTLVLPLLLPPLLFAASQQTSTREFIDHARSLLALAVGLVIVTTAAVAGSAHLVDHRLGWASAIALGALVAPPDPIAASSVAERLRLPKRVSEILEGEGLLNDATSLIVYTLAVSVADGSLTLARGLQITLVSVIGAPIVGYLVGRLGSAIIEQLDDPRAEVALTLLLPYGAYLAIDAAHGSGVLAVVVTGLYIGQRGVSSFTSSGFLTGATVWSVADWTVSNLTFGLIGFQLTTVLKDPTIATHGASIAAVTTVVAIGVRALFVIPLGFVLRRWPGTDRERNRGSWRESIVISWAGMRGVVTLAGALALPDAFPSRPVVLFAAIVIVLVTLVGQGLTLPLVVRGLGVRADDEDDGRDETRKRAVGAALERLEELRAAGEVDEEVAASLERAYRTLAPDLDGGVDAGTRQRMLDFSEASREMRDAERSLVLELRSSGEITADAASHVLHDLESRELRGERQVEIAQSADGAEITATE